MHVVLASRHQLRFHGVVGYHVRLTRERSPVRTRMKPIFWCLQDCQLTIGFCASDLLNCCFATFLGLLHFACLSSKVIRFSKLVGSLPQDHNYRMSLLVLQDPKPAE